MRNTDKDRQPQRQSVSCTCVIFIIRHGDAPWQLPLRVRNGVWGITGNPCVQVAACTQLGVVVGAGQLWICLYLFMLMRRSDTPETTTARQQQPQLIKHLHAHKTSTCILYLLEFLSCRYTSGFCLFFSLPCSENFLSSNFIVVVPELCVLQSLPTPEIVRTVRHVLTLSHLSARHKARNKRNEKKQQQKNTCA